MSVLGNILWILLGGLVSAVSWCAAGLLCCVTIVGIPLGVQCFKIAGLVLAPFGRSVSYNGTGVGHVLGDILWLIFCGLELAIGSFVWGCVLCVTIIGIPFGKQYFKIARLALTPFGASVN